MKALTLWQPWASLVVLGAKPFEFPGWRPSASIIGQRIVIHAAARKVDRDDLRYLTYALAAGGVLAAETCLHPGRAREILCADHWPLAAGLGTAIVGEPRIGTDIAADFGVPRANDSDRDEHANWGWPMLAIEAWPEPVPMRGAQGLWNWPTPADAGLSA